ncbi:Flagellar basal-body rod protein FlgB [Dissulfuribacter thermophilus]|uniref:Flagellar basal body rod protein FlgB n=1 Tax=Dissulfuribacter thermophilus TaxID=1156395 RepID=A0A1B9F4U8_9BACT|nr:flagellar basal body rod protein FlgB [Dissulfuribacter thermophilus]OCC14883.1 Flagellar basal-body rod protein FlgB [Dissulfuribacter thermophilus]
MKGLFGKGFNILEKAISVRTKRNAVLSANISNVDTPGYKAKDIPFEKVMARYLSKEPKGLELAKTNSVHLPKKPPVSRTHPEHLPKVNEEKLSQSDEGIIVESEERGTPNNVDLDIEMAKLAENNLQYQATLQILIRRLEGLKNAVTEGGRP